MTKSICLSLILSLLTLNPINADTTELKPRFRLSEFNLSFGTVHGNRPDRIALSDFQKLAPGSALLASDFATYRGSGFYHYKDLYLLQVSAGLKNTLKANGPVYRFGFSFGSGQRAEGSYSRYNSIIIDTLVSPRTGHRVYIDSSSSSYYAFSAVNVLLQIDLSAIWRSRNPNKLTFFGGAGVCGGLSLWSASNLEHTEYSRVSGAGMYYSGRQSATFKTVFEQINGKQHSILAVYLPFGIDYRLSKKHSFWKNLHLFQETRLRLQYYKFPELSAETEANFFMSMGLRYCPS